MTLVGGYFGVGLQEGDRHIVKYLVVSVVSLFIGTVMGVLQVFPALHNWVVNTGQAGAWIDPLAHTHINLVGGVTVGMMGLVYYALPRVLKRPLYSRRLADASFWFSLIGVYLFFFVLLALGVAEGSYIGTHVPGIWGAAPVDGHTVNLLYYHAESRFYWLDELMVPGGILMGLGYWGFIANVLLSVYHRKERMPAAPKRMVGMKETYDGSGG